MGWGNPCIGLGKLLSIHVAGWVEIPLGLDKVDY